MRQLGQFLDVGLVPRLITVLQQPLQSLAQAPHRLLCPARPPQRVRLMQQRARQEVGVLHSPHARQRRLEVVQRQFDLSPPPEYHGARHQQGRRQVLTGADALVQRLHRLRVLPLLAVELGEAGGGPDMCFVVSAALDKF